MLRKLQLLGTRRVELGGKKKQLVSAGGTAETTRILVRGHVSVQLTVGVSSRCSSQAVSKKLDNNL